MYASKQVHNILPKEPNHRHKARKKTNKYYTLNAYISFWSNVCSAQVFEAHLMYNTVDLIHVRAIKQHHTLRVSPTFEEIKEKKKTATKTAEEDEENRKKKK